MSGEAASGIFIGSAAGGANPQRLELSRANRHGLIAGATGTGKTVTLQGIVEGLSAAGIPTFVADVKGDLSGLAMAGSPTGKMHDIFAGRAAEIGYADWQYRDCPVPPTAPRANRACGARGRNPRAALRGHRCSRW